MGEENLQNTGGKESEEHSTTPDVQDSGSIELIVNPATNELTIVDPSSGRRFVVKARIEIPEETEEEEQEEKKPLTVDEFRTVLEKLDALGITWTADIPTLPTFKKGASVDDSTIDNYRKLQEQYPRFPRELGAIILHGLLGQGDPPPVIGGEEEFKGKIELLRGTLLTHDYRTEFFFRYAIKVPYFEDIDWEVVVKAYERGVQEMPKIAYALLTLALRKPVDTTRSVEEGASEIRRPEFIAVAVNEQTVDRLMGRLADIKRTLAKAQKAADTLTDQATPEEGHADEPNS